GLTASLMLSRLGIKSLLVERHPGTAIHPKARGINARTMEVFHQQGIEDEVRAAGLPPSKVGFIVWTKTLAGEEIERRVTWGQSTQRAEVTPVRACLCAQDYLEPVLRRCAERQPLGTLRFDTELTTFEQSDSGVTATITSTRTGASEQVSSQYLIAADGALLHRERGDARHLPHHQRARPLGLPGQLAAGAWPEAGGFHARVFDRD